MICMKSFDLKLDYILININPIIMRPMAILFLLEIFSLKISKPPILINTILPALYIGNAMDAFNVSSERIKKKEENKFGIPTAIPVNISLLLIFEVSCNVKNKLIKKATKNMANKNISLY